MNHCINIWLTAHCGSRSDPWSIEILTRLENCIDFVLKEALYHRYCYVKCLNSTVSWTSVRIELHCVRWIREWTLDQGPRAWSMTSRQDVCRCLGCNFSQGACWPGGIHHEHRKQDPNKYDVKSYSIIGPCHEDKWLRRLGNRTFHVPRFASVHSAANEFLHCWEGTCDGLGSFPGESVQLHSNWLR